MLGALADALKVAEDQLKADVPFADYAWIPFSGLLSSTACSKTSALS